MIPGFSQETYSPSKVRKAAYFDKTPPLITMEKKRPVPGDNHWKDGIISNESLLEEFTSGDKSVTDPATIQDYQGAKGSKGPIVNVNGIGNINGVYPPDTDGDAGPDHYIQMINLSFAVYDKQGTKIYGPVANSTLWSGFPGPWTGTNDGDPILLYDELAGRWMASQFAIYTSNNKYYELIAVSETNDPLGAWYRYAFEFDEFPDYPKLSVWPDGYYATFHIFSGSFQGTAFVAFEREKMLIGDPDAQMVYFGEYPTRFGYLPADVDGQAPPAGTPCYFSGINFSGNHSMEIWTMTLEWLNTANSQFILDVVLPTASFNANVSGIPQPGTGTQLDALNGILMFRLPYRNFGTYSSIVANHTVNLSGHAAIRWYELRNTGSDWYIYQQGTYSPDNNHRWMGSIAMQADGSIALGYSVSSSSIYPSIRYTGRTPDAPLGEMNITEIEVAAGLSSQSGIERWGDYACMSADPVNDSLFWFTTEYMAGGGWGTRITSFDFGSIQPPVAFAGVDTTICENQLFECMPSAQFYNSVHWETSGDGVFQNQNILFTKYLRGNGDIENGQVTLTLTAYGFQPGWEVSDDMVLSITREPEAFAGNDTVVSGSNIILAGEAISYSAVEWSSSGDGIFTDVSILNPTYTAGPEDISLGQATLTLMAMAQLPCEGEDSDNMTLFLNPATGIFNPDPLYSRIQIIPNPGSGKFMIRYVGPGTDEDIFIVRDLTGSVVAGKDNMKYLSSGSFELDLSGFRKGIFILELQTRSGKVFEKIVLK